MRKKRLGQSTAEYATLFAIILGAVVAMQLYVKRAIQAKQKDAFMVFARNLGFENDVLQYEPYYVDKNIQQNVRSHRNEDLSANAEYDSFGNTVVTYSSGGYDKDRGWKDIKEEEDIY